MTTLNELFPIPAAARGDDDELLARALDRWGAERLADRRGALGEDVDELLMPALDALLDEVGLRHLVLDDGTGDAPFTAAPSLVAALERVGRADAGIAVVLAGALALQATGDRLAPPLRRGLGALVLPGYGPPSEAFGGLNAPARALRRGDLLRLDSDGPVRPQCRGLAADWFGVACELTTDGGSVPAVVAVAADAAGLRRGEPIRQTGLAVSQNADLTFSGVEVPASHLLGSGVPALRALEAWYRLGAAAACQGAMDAAHAILAEWGEVRVIKGRGQVFRENPLVAGQMGAIAARGASSRLQLSAAALLLGEAAAAGTAGSSSVSAAMTATFITVARAAMESLDLTMELMASAGYSTEWQLERPWRDVKTIQTLVGPAPELAIELARHAYGCEQL